VLFSVIFKMFMIIYYRMSVVTAESSDTDTGDGDEKLVECNKDKVVFQDRVTFQYVLHCYITLYSATAA